MVEAIRGESSDNQLHLVAHPFGEEGAQRAVGQPVDEDGVGGRPTLATEEAAGDTARSVEFLLKIDHEREEVEPLPHGLGHGGGCQEKAIANTVSDSAACLFGKPPCGKGNLAVTDGRRKRSFFSHCSSDGVPALPRQATIRFAKGNRQMLAESRST